MPRKRKKPQYCIYLDGCLQEWRDSKQKALKLARRYYRGADVLKLVAWNVGKR